METNTRSAHTKWAGHLNVYTGIRPTQLFTYPPAHQRPGCRPVANMFVGSTSGTRNFMKKTGLLNQPLSAIIAGLGHLDTLVIADAGLPIPAQTQRIDLAVSAGLPPFLDVLQAVLGEMQLQSAIIAKEMSRRSPEMQAALLKLLGDIPVEL